MLTYRAFRNILHRKLLSHGWLVMQVDPAARGWQSGRVYDTPEYIRRLGFKPRTLVDVGVARGTPPLYEAYPEPYLVLIEPLAETIPFARDILKHRPGVFVQTGLGERDETRTILVEPRYIERSSTYHRAPIDQTGDKTQPREIPITTLDALQAKYRWEPPFGLKIDTEGCELEVIRGASEFLRDTIFVMVEVNVLNRFPGSYSFAEFIQAMDVAGFAMCDILEIARTSAADLNFLDLVFRRKAQP